MTDPETADTGGVTTGTAPEPYSDFTGALRSTVTLSEGYYTRIIDSRLNCSTSVFWDQIWIEAEAPAGTQIELWARTAEDYDQLGLSPEVLVAELPGYDGSPIDTEFLFDTYGLPNTLRYVELRVVLRSLDGVTSPILRQMDSVFYCQEV